MFYRARVKDGKGRYFLRQHSFGEENNNGCLLAYFYEDNWKDNFLENNIVKFYISFFKYDKSKKIFSTTT